MIQITNLSKTFASGGVDALRDVNLSVKKGDIFGIIGMSGAGKSTLLRCIALLETPTTGTIEIGGVNVSSLRGRELLAHHRDIGVIFQGYHLLFQRTVRENIAFPLELERMRRKEIYTRTDELLALVGLADKADFYPAQLSGGQKQRVAIARALAGGPQILLCDEPTAALDTLTTKSMLELLRDINQKLNVTVVVITHEIGVVRTLCNRVAVIDRGTIVEEGSTELVLQHPQSETAKLLLGVEEEVE